MGRGRGMSEKSRLKSKGSGKRRSGEDAEVKEIWETVAGGDLEV